MDFIGRYENLQEDFDSVLAALGLPQIALGHDKKSVRRKRASYAGFYDEVSRQIVEKKQGEALKVFGYEFDDQKNS